jgi:feruloyl esterase
MLALLSAASIRVSPASAAIPCASLGGVALPNTTILLAVQNAATATVPAHCEIIGDINRRTGELGLSLGIKFHLRMPDAWNGRLYFAGGGGTEGNLGSATGEPLNNGYAMLTTDAGHDNAINTLTNAGGAAAFGADPQARVDYGYNSLDKATVAAKELIQAYYGRSPDYSYFVGCSDGGRQGMQLWTRYPHHFDGVVAQSPGVRIPMSSIAGTWNAQTLAPLATRVSTRGQPYLPDTLPTADLVLAGDAILKACDKLDGLEDGIVDDYAACTNRKVHRELDAIQCPGAKDATCLSPGQVEALKTMFAGPKNSKGRALYTSWPWDPGIGRFTSGSLQAWSIGTVPSNPAAPLTNNAVKIGLGGGALPMLWTTPPVLVSTLTQQPPEVLDSEDFYFAYDFDVDAPKVFATSGIYTESSAGWANPPVDEVEGSWRRRGKLIMHHGMSDGAFSAFDTVRWYKRLDREMHGRASRSVRLFLVPGMGHCGGGPATVTSQTVAFAALVDWVEHGVAPDFLIGTASANAAQTPWPNRTRPICAYPKQARYKGTGSIEDEANFQCVHVRHDGGRGRDDDDDETDDDRPDRGGHRDRD